MGFEPVTSRYLCDALLKPTKLWSHWCRELVNYVFICSHENDEYFKCTQLWTQFMPLHKKAEKHSGLHFFQASYDSIASSWGQILLKSWIFFRPLRQLYKLCSQLRGSFFIWCIKFTVILPLSHFAVNPYNCSDSESGNHGTPSNNSYEPDGESNCFANV